MSEKHLHSDEWLAEAKRLHVGESKRTYHGAERRPNLVIKNHADKYTAWCFSCHKGGVVRKELVRAVQPQLPKERPALSADPGVCWQVQFLQAPEFKAVVLHLQSKDMSLPYLAHLNPQYSFRDHRLVLNTPECRIGRDVTGQHKAKWHTYNDDVGYTRAAFKEFKDAHVVLTEDMYSACKVQYYMPDVLAVACLGTRISPALMTKLLTCDKVSTWFDGDSAGNEARLVAGRSLSTMDVLYSHIVSDKDPKAYTGDEIKGYLI